MGHLNKVKEDKKEILKTEEVEVSVKGGNRRVRRVRVREMKLLKTDEVEVRVKGGNREERRVRVRKSNLLKTEEVEVIFKGGNRRQKGQRFIRGLGKNIFRILRWLGKKNHWLGLYASGCHPSGRYKKNT